MNDTEISQGRVTLDITVDSDICEVERVVELVKEKCLEACVDPHICDLNVRVAVSEAMANAILKGNGKTGQHVRIRGIVLADSFVVEVQDEGKGFNLAYSRKDPKLVENRDLEGGRGLYLMTVLMDEVEVAKTQSGTVRMRIHRG